MRQLELAASCDDPDERAARCTFVVVGEHLAVPGHPEVLACGDWRVPPGPATERQAKPRSR